MSTRYVVLGLARPRSGWFGEVGRWATSGSVPLEFVRCVAREELTANLTSGRPFSAVLIDAGVHGLDRDLVELAREAGSATIVVDDAVVHRDWQALGIGTVLPPDFDRADLVAALDTHAVAVERTAITLDPTLRLADGAGNSGRDDAHRWVSVMGSGSGASVLAMALAQELGAAPSADPETPPRRPRRTARTGVRRRGRPRPARAVPDGPVLLADLALDADQAVLHDAPDIVPGVSELVEAFRGGRVDIAGVRGLAFAVEDRGYHLLLGLRRHRDWAGLRPRAVEAALDGLGAAFPLVVADIDADIEGEADCGSIDVEERNALARSALRRADAVVVVGTADLLGMHTLVGLLWRLHAFGIEPRRVVPVINRAPRHPRARAELARAVAELGPGRTAHVRSAERAHHPPAVHPDPGEAVPAGPVFVPVVRRLDLALRDGERLPGQLGASLATAVRAVLEGLEPRADEGSGPVAIRPGELGGGFGGQVAS